MNMSKTRKRIYIAALVLVVVFIVVFALQRGLIPPRIVIYYDEILSTEALHARGGSAQCGGVRVENQLEWLALLFSSQPSFRCFDTFAELEAWMAVEHADKFTDNP